jgi:hypothetical protein
MMELQGNGFHPGGSCGLPDSPDHLTGSDDSQPSERDLLEVPISGHQGVRVGSQGQGNQVIVLRVVRYHPGRVDRIIEQDAFVGEAVRKAIRLLSGDVVLLGDPRMQQGLLDLVNELRADNHLELTVLPEIDELGCCAGWSQDPRDETIGIDDDPDG